ncbi:hypothetical protein SAMN02745157_0660 [Kaistia soli DSM 19436]|uniref:Uncharacterized protein n=1 Tax=Kaistia soli DSM 19436 TaxID=1122133 RepID=A0A1M4VBD3_9HYPH|nr:hypothetical protein [Kaistia soli]SHE66301.1 hypothetical protein SAMN02745157_0660 [Kaistia soli DSM 19436]
MSASVDPLRSAARALLDAITNDDSGQMGRGGNGGLISRETIRTADELRLALDAAGLQGRRDHG